MSTRLWSPKASDENAVAEVNAWLLPVAVIAIGFVNWLLARSLSAKWLLRGSWPMMLGGLGLLVAAAFPTIALVVLYVAAGLLLVAMVCVTFSIVRRELARQT